MSAILGVLHLNNQRVEPPYVRRMVESLAHRGPDRQDVWIEECLGLGHCMLYNTPESLGECLPLVYGSGDLVLTADARLDNRIELINKLQIETSPNKVITDSELILAAYLEWGEDSPKHLLGDFSFAIWDRHKKRLFCARDIASVKPFFYYCTKKLFAFASEYKALFCLPDVPRKMNEGFVADYLGFVLGETTQTIYQDVLQLPGAHSLLIDQEGVRSHRYWSLDPTLELNLGSEKEYAQAFLEIFTDAVRCRLRSAYPVASMLSGGLDSSSIVCVARELFGSSNHGRLHAFSGIFPGLKEAHPRSDESKYMEAVAQGGGICHHYLNIEKMSSLSKDILSEYEHIPQVNMYLDWSVFRAAKAQGARVVLTGTDGDTTVGYGISHLEDLFRTGRWISLAREVNAIARKVGRSRRRILKRFILEPTIMSEATKTWRRIRRLESDSWDRRSLIRPEFARKVGLEERIRGRQQKPIRGVSKSREVHWQDLSSGLWPTFLEACDDLAGTIPVEVRYPFFDRRLMEFCLALPGELKLKNGWTRYILRLALDGILPPEIQWRDWKGSFGVNSSLGLFEQSQEILDTVILSNTTILEEYINVQALQASYQRFLSAPHKHVDDAFIVFWNAALAICLENSGIES